jgi:hypothetical protein
MLPYLAWRAFYLVKRQCFVYIVYIKRMAVLQHGADRVCVRRGNMCSFCQQEGDEKGSGCSMSSGPNFSFLPPHVSDCSHHMAHCQFKINCNEFELAKRWDCSQSDFVCTRLASRSTSAFSNSLHAEPPSQTAFTSSVTSISTLRDPQTTSRHNPCWCRLDERPATT